MNVGALLQSQLSRCATQPFWEALYKICVRGMGYNNYDPEWNGEYRALLEYLNESMRKPEPVVFDVGANEGAFTAKVLEAAAGAKIHAFEPNPPTAQRLRLRFQGREQVRINSIGLSDKPGELVLVDYEGGRGTEHATFRPESLATIQPGGAAEAPLRPLTQHKVPVTTLDAYAAENDIDTIDYLKIDVEGVEQEVLAGARGLLADRRVSCAQIEVNAHNAVVGFTLYRLLKVFEGYRCFKILPDGLYPIRYRAFHDLFRYANFLFVLN